MGRDAIKASGNVWYQARKDASNWNEKLSSRAGAAELLGMSEDAVRAAETGLDKCMPVEKAVLMADLYNKPELEIYYCKHECPISRHLPLSYESVTLDRVTVKLIKNLRVEDLEDVKNRLIDIAEDGAITEDEREDFCDILKYLERLAKTVSELRTLGERVLGNLDEAE